MTPERPFFIVGCPRSGTTLLRLLLHAHSRLAVAPENYMISENLPLAGGRVDAAATAWAIVSDYHFVDFGLDAGEVREAVERLDRPLFADVLRVVYEAYARRLGKQRWGDQTPSYVVHMERILEMFPTGQFVHVIRDARDVALSWRKLEEHRHHSWWRIGNTWRWYVTAGRAAGRRLGPGIYHEVFYEELTREPEASLRRICGFLDEDFEPAMLEFHRQAPEHIPRRMAETHHRKLVSPILSRNSGKWRAQMSRWERLAVEIPAGMALRAAGYPVSVLGLAGAPLELARGLTRRLLRRSRVPGAN